jgi:hypothetical protein
VEEDLGFNKGEKSSVRPGCRKVPKVLVGRPEADPKLGWSFTNQRLSTALRELAQSNGRSNFRERVSVAGARRALKRMPFRSYCDSGRPHLRNTGTVVDPDTVEYTISVRSQSSRVPAVLSGVVIRHMGGGGEARAGKPRYGAIRIGIPARVATCISSSPAMYDTHQNPPPGIRLPARPRQFVRQEHRGGSAIAQEVGGRLLALSFSLRPRCDQLPERCLEFIPWPSVNRTTGPRFDSRFRDVQ